MSLGVSQIDYWRQTSQPPTTTKTATSTPTSKDEGGPGAQYLSYPVFMGLTILGGFFALDHLYLRSPATFLAKFIVNILCFGVWWLYDISQAIFNMDVVKVFGLPIPGMGPKGIGAGVFASGTPDRKHLSFLFYGLSLIFGGIFGMDSFIVGDKGSGLVRLISFVTIIFAPVAIGWWIYKLFKFFFNTRDVTDKYWEYFGAPKPHEKTLSTTEWLVYKFPFLSYIFGPIKTIKEAAVAPIEAIETVVKDPTTLATGPISKIVKAVTETAAETAAVGFQPLIIQAQTLEKPVMNAVKGAEDMIDKSLNVVKKGIGAVEEVAGAVRSTVDATAPLVEAASDLLRKPVPATEEIKGVLGQIGGGGLLQNTSVLGFTLMGVISLIAVSGMVLTYLRSRKTNGRPERNDTPPQPGVLRVPNKEKPTSST